MMAFLSGLCLPNLVVSPDGGPLLNLTALVTR